MLPDLHGDPTSSHGCPANQKRNADQDAAGNEIEGRVEVALQEHRWRFIPSTPWNSERYVLKARTDLEDLAGNSIGRPFEVDRFDRVRSRVSVSTISLNFETTRN